MKTSRWIRCLLLFGSFSVMMVAHAQPLFRDDFNGSISDLWTIKEANEGLYSITATNLDLRASRGDLYDAYNNYRNLFLITNPAPDDFVITAHVDAFVPNAKGFPQFSLIAYDSDDDYVRCSYGFIGHERALEFGSEVNVSYHSNLRAHDFGNGSFYLQLRKSGNSYTQYYSTDGTNYVQANPPVIYGDDNPAQLGFIAMVDPTESSHAFVDYFEVTEAALPSWIERVAPTGNNASPDASIEIIFRNFEKMDATFLQLFVDKISVTPELLTGERGSVTVRYQPAELLDPGSSHSVRVIVPENGDRMTIHSFSYEFSVSSKIILSK